MAMRKAVQQMAAHGPESGQATPRTRSAPTKARVVATGPAPRREFAVEPMNRMGNLVAPFLDDGERSHLSFTAKIGPTPWVPITISVAAGIASYFVARALPISFFGFQWWVGIVVGLAVLTLCNLFLYRPRIVAVTSTNVLALKADRLIGTPTGIVTREPRGIQIGPAKGIHAKSTIGAETMWVPLRWRALLDVSDRARPRQKSDSDVTLDLRRPDATRTDDSTRPDRRAADRHRGTDAEVVNLDEETTESAASSDITAKPDPDPAS